MCAGSNTVFEMRSTIVGTMKAALVKKPAGPQQLLAT